MDRTLRNELVKLLSEIPGLESFQGRLSILNGIPGSDFFRRDENDAYTHICLMVDQSVSGNWSEGKKNIEILIDNSLPRVKDTELGKELSRLKEKILKQRPSMPELVEPDNFDLVEQIRRFFNENTFLTPTLHIFSFSCASRDIMKYFCSKIIYELKDQIEGNIFDITNHRIDPKHTSVDDVCRIICKHCGVLREMNVLASIQVGKMDDESLLRKKLEEQFNDEMDNHLIVVIQHMPEKENSSFFQSADIRNWIVEIVKIQEWPKSIINDWMRLVFTECGEHLDTDAVYFHIENIKRFFNGRFSHEIFKDYIETRLSIYAETKT